MPQKAARELQFTLLSDQKQ